MYENSWLRGEISTNIATLELILQQKTIFTISNILISSLISIIIYLRQLNQRLGALKRICKLTNFKNRKMIANGLFVSKISYLICLWGGCSGQIQKTLQVVLNKAARLVSKCDWSVSTKETYKQIG